MISNPQYWLAELDQHGNPTLADGPHPSQNGVEKAMYLYDRFGLTKGKRFVLAEVFLRPVEARPHGANEDALSTLNAIGLRP